jgi:streptomycin 6-kinase
MATAADRLERASVSDMVVLHGDLVPGNILLKQDGELLGIDPQAVVGEIEAAAASWGLLRSNGDEQGWRAGGGAVRRALLLCSVLGADSERTLAHLSFQALELACRQAYWGEWEWVSESLDVSRAAAAALR